MDMPPDFDRIMFFEQARMSAERAYAKDPRDADNLTRWGSALLELASFQAPHEAKVVLEDAVSKFEEALEVQSKPETLWCLGNAMTALGFSDPDPEVAGAYFDKATDSFRRASEADPANSLFLKSIEIASKAPELHAEFHKEGFGPRMAAAAAESQTTSKKSTTKNKKSSDLKYDIMGWVILGTALFVWTVFAKDHMPEAPPQPR